MSSSPFLNYENHAKNTEMGIGMVGTELLFFFSKLNLVLWAWINKLIKRDYFHMIGNYRGKNITMMEHGTQCTLLTATNYICNVIMIHWFPTKVQNEYIPDILFVKIKEFLSLKYILFA